MRSWRLHVVLLALAAVIGLIVAHVTIPSYVARRIEAELMVRVPHSDDVRVRLSAFPAFRLLWGSIDSVDIVIAKPQLNDLQLDSFRVWGQNVRLDNELLTMGTLAVREAEQLSVEAVIGEEALTAYLRNQLPSLTDVRVDLRPDVAVLHGTTVLLGHPIDLVVGGGLELIDGTRVQFVPTDVAIEQQSIPPALIELASLRWQWDLNLSGIPFPVQIQSIAMEQGRLVARGMWER